MTTQIHLFVQPYTGTKGGLFSVLVYYQNLVRFPPAGYEYVLELKPAINVPMGRIYQVYRVLNRLGFDIKGLYNRLLLKRRRPSGLVHMACATVEHGDYIVDVEAISNLLPNLGDRRHVAKVGQDLASPRCKAILCWSGFVRDRLQGLYPHLGTKLRVVYPAFEAQPRRPITEVRRITFVGWDFLRKGGWEVLEAVRRAAREHPDIALRCISGVPDAIRADYADVPQIEFTGAVPHDRLYSEVYPTTDLLLFPTRYEAFGLVTLEAFSFGIPVIASDSPVQAELVGAPEFLVPLHRPDVDADGFILLEEESYKRDKASYDEGEVQGLVERIVRLVRDPALAEAESQRVHAEVATGRFSFTARDAAYRDALGPPESGQA